MTLKVLALLSQDVFRLSMGWVLEELGHRVYYLNQIQEDTLEQAIRTFAPDIFFDMGWDAHFKPVRIPLLGAILKKYRLYHVYFAEEDWLHFERWSKQYITQVTPHFVLTRSRRCLPEYCGMGIRAAYLDVGCNPSFHRTVAPHSTYACDVSVAANAQLRWDIFRRQSIANLVLALSETPHNFQIWGGGWDEIESHYGVANPSAKVWKGVLPYAKTPVLYNSSSINLSIQSVEDQVSNRTYDILAAGGFLLTSDTPGVREQLQPGVHCDVSASAEETREKVSFYLANESVRNRIAKAGQEYARRQFSYQRTLPAVWQLVEQDLARFRGAKRR